MPSEYLYSVRSLKELRKQFPEMTVKSTELDHSASPCSLHDAPCKSTSAQAPARPAKKKLAQ